MPGSPTLKRDEFYDLSPRIQHARSNLRRTDKSPKVYQSGGNRRHSASDRAVDAALFSTGKYSSGPESAAKHAKEFEKMTRRTLHTNTPDLDAAKTSRRIPEKGIGIAHYRRAPPQDAPMETSSHMGSHTPGQGLAGVRSSRTVNMEGEEHMHDPVQSPPFVLSSSTQNRATKHDPLGKAAKSSEMRQRKENTSQEPSSLNSNGHPSHSEIKKSSAMQETVYLQEARIDSLERENRALRTQVKRLIELLEDTGKMDTEYSVPEYEADVPDEQYFTSERQNESYGLRGSYRDYHSPSPHSPGTRFVAELCEMMELDPGHHALLSTIMDNHYDGINRLESSYPDV